jgi:ligand-binding SRPBCC domain-containing protein
LRAARRASSYDPPVPTFHHETILPFPIEHVWAFHQDITGALPKLTDPAEQMRIEHADLPPREGTKVVITAKGPLGRRIKWVAVYTAFVPPHPVVAGVEARFVDEQQSGPFKRWRHSHEFEAVDSKTTRLTDHIDYTVPLGPLGWVGDLLIVRRKLKSMFAYRAKVLPELLSTWRAR